MVQNPVLSLSLSLSVSEELKANPFDLTIFPFPLLEEGAEPRQLKHRERKVEAQHHLKEDDPKVQSLPFLVTWRAWGGGPSLRLG